MLLGAKILREVTLLAKVCIEQLIISYRRNKMGLGLGFILANVTLLKHSRYWLTPAIQQKWVNCSRYTFMCLSVMPSQVLWAVVSQSLLIATVHENAFHCKLATSKINQLQGCMKKDNKNSVMRPLLMFRKCIIRKTSDKTWYWLTTFRRRGKDCTL